MGRVCCGLWTLQHCAQAQPKPLSPPPPLPCLSNAPAESSGPKLPSRRQAMPISPLDLTVQDKSKASHDGSSLFKGKKVMLYFSAHWCPPCRGFTPVLAKFYAEAKAAKQPVECVFVSCDRDEAAMWSYFSESHGDYYVVPYSAPERSGLSEQYHVSGIPCLVIVDETGKVIKENARGDVQGGDVACISQWN